MPHKILVTYASRAGSTQEVAEFVGRELSARGFNVDVRPVKQAGARGSEARGSEAGGYDAVVVGSAVRFGQWLPEAVKFIQANQAALQKVPVAYFAVHLMNQGEDPAARAARLSYLDAARKLVAPQTEAFFTGVGDPAKISFIEGLIGRLVKSPEGDFRDWEAIRAWAQEIAPA